MQTYLDCVPCLLRQAVEASRMIGATEMVQETLVRQIMQELASGDFSQSPPQLAQSIHRHIRAVTGQQDPYHEIKGRFNTLALHILPQLEEIVSRSQHPLTTAIRLAIAGNVIDMGISAALQDSQVMDAIDHALDAPLQGDPKELAQAIAGAKQILYLTDNAGEIVFDRLLLQQLPLERVTVAVKGSPVINDATREDAKIAGIDQLATLIDNGSDAPGTILSDCSERFRRHFEQANLIIAKGQGNYESLSGCAKQIFFILKAKCPVIAKDLDCKVGDLILRHSTK